jgi:hypothetical protein
MSQSEDEIDEETSRGAPKSDLDDEQMLPKGQTGDARTGAIGSEGGVIYEAETI